MERRVFHERVQDFCCWVSFAGIIAGIGIIFEQKGRVSGTAVMRSTLMLACRKDRTIRMVFGLSSV
jgi:hypothetical protein